MFHAPSQGRTSDQIMVPRPGGAPTDLPIYRRNAINATGCVSGIEVGSADGGCGGRT